LTERIYELLQPRVKEPWPEVCARLNAQLRVWRQYFGYGTLARAYQIVNRYVEKRVRYFLRSRHRHSTKGTRRFPSQLIFGELSVMRLARSRPCVGLV
jgi:hypothetical protein